MNSLFSEKASALAMAADHVYNALEASLEGDYDVLLDETIEAQDSLEGCQAMMEDDEPDALPFIELCKDNCARVLVSLIDDEDVDPDAIEETLNVTGGLILDVSNALSSGSWDEFIDQLSGTIPVVHRLTAAWRSGSHLV